MRRVLALAVLMAFMPTANAQDTAKAEFTPSAEYRARYFWMQNPGGDADTMGTDSFANHRFKLGASFKANEKFSAHISLLHDASFGQMNAETTGQFDQSVGGAHEENFMNVYEAYATWMVSEDFNLKVGRQGFQMADGSVMALNDWQQQPTAFEGVLGSFEAEFGRFQAFAFKYKELTGAAGHPTAGSSASKDPEHNAYGINFDLKTMPEWLKSLNVHVIKDNADGIVQAVATPITDPTVNSLTGHDTIRYGVNAAFAFSMFDAKAWYEMQSGKYTNALDDGTVADLDAAGTMYQLEIGASFEEFMKSRFYAQYHVDSGDTDGTDGEQGTYDPYFYERHANAGLMDLIGWGNLTYIQVGGTLMPMDNTTVGVAYTMFSRTENDSASRPGDNGGTLAAGGTSDKIGDEIDLWAERAYDGGLSTVLRLGYFTPGSYLKDGGSEDNIMHVMLEGKLTF